MIKNQRRAVMAEVNPQHLEGVPALLSPEVLDRLAGLAVTKLLQQNGVPAFQAGCRGFESRLPL